MPFLGVVVAPENDLLVLFDDPGEDRSEALEVARLQPLERIGELLFQY